MLAEKLRLPVKQETELTPELEDLGGRLIEFCEQEIEAKRLDERLSKQKEYVIWAYLTRWADLVDRDGQNMAIAWKSSSLATIQRFKGVDLDEKDFILQSKAIVEAREMAPMIKKFLQAIDDKRLWDGFDSTLTPLLRDELSRLLPKA